MSFVINLTKVSKLGDYDETYGQRYWCLEEDSNTPVSFNSQNQEIESDCSIECEEKTMKKSKKGVTYWQLKKVRVIAEAGNTTTQAEKPATTELRASQEASTTAYTTTNSPATDVVLKALTRIEAKLDKLLGKDEALEDEVASKIDAAKDAHDDPEENYDEEPINMDDIPF